MTYDPRRYWKLRSLKQGPSYVGPGGDVEVTGQQAVELAEIIRGRLAGRRFGRCLDFGCGSGRMTEVLSEFADEYIGVDLNESGLAQARMRCPGADYRWLETDVIPVPSSSVDLVVAITVIQHIVADTDWKTWSRQLRRVMTPTATALIIDATSGVGPHMQLRTPDQIARALGANVGEAEYFPGHWVALMQLPRDPE